MHGGIFGRPTSLGMIHGGGIFARPTSLGNLTSGGIFNGGALGGVVEDQIAQCVRNRTAQPCAFSQALRQELIDGCIVDSGYTKSSSQCDPCPTLSAAQLQTQCEQFVNTSVDCATKCKAFRQDSPEWAACVQKCHGYTPVDYSAQKAGCEAQGKVYSWLEGGCVSKEKYASCPAGTVYATYDDGSEKCIGIPTDLTKAECPPGTSLKTVPGGQTCVSPIVPTDKKTTTPTRIEPPKTPGTTKNIAATKSESKAGIPLAIAAVAVLGALGLYLMNKKNEQQPEEEFESKPELMSRPNCDCW